jgi:hypothetical protein
MLQIVIQVILGVIFANIVEVLAHKYVLHELGKKKDSWFHHHWKHHHVARKLDFYDPGYTLPFWKPERFKEIVSIVLLAFLMMPFWFYFKIFTVTLWIYSLFYLILHRYMHLHPEFAKKWFKTHWQHHMQGNQEHSWGVICPLIDIILGTRK